MITNMHVNAYEKSYKGMYGRSSNEMEEAELRKAIIRSPNQTTLGESILV